MSARTATHEDAQLILKLYELRREEKLRVARDWFTAKFWPQSFEDFKALQTQSALETYYRMVVSYWDMAASFVVRGVLNPELFLESGGEMLYIWAKIEPFLGDLRNALGSPAYLANIDEFTRTVPGAKERLEAAKQRIKQMMEQAKAAKG